MAAYAQFGYGGYPSASQFLASQSPQTGDTPSAPQSSHANSSAAPPPLSPSLECRSGAGVNAGDVSSGALSPDAMSQHSNSAAVAGGGAGAAGAARGPGLIGSGSGGGGGGLEGGASSGPLGHAGGATTAAAGGSCCENGRPIMTDPVSGQTVCSCQYDSARLALSSYSRLPAASVGVYGTPYPSTDQNPYQSIGVDSSAFYSPLSNPYALKDSATAATEMTAWTSAGLQPTTGYYSYDPMSAYGYGASYDLAARRKNATRESTATLKAWLNEHKKNPYPTKGEKIMLAIITKMTLTQVSTWFANARRRLKKENKMTWEPKNRTDDDEDAMVSDDDKDKDDTDGGSVVGDKATGPGGIAMHGTNASLSGGNASVALGVGLGAMGMDHGKDPDKDDDELTDDERKPGGGQDLRSSLGYHGGGGAHPAHGYHPYHHHQHPAYYQHQQAMLAASYHVGATGSGGGGVGGVGGSSGKNELSDPKNQLSRDCGVPIPATKPKIWSLADTVACKTPPPAAYMGHHHLHQSQSQSHQQQQQHLMQHQLQQHMSGSQSGMAGMGGQPQHSQLPQPQHHIMPQQSTPLQQQQQQQLPLQQPAPHMMSNFGAAPYSRAPTTAYGGFLGGPMAQQLHTMNSTHYNTTSSSNNTTNHNNNNSMSSLTISNSNNTNNNSTNNAMSSNNTHSSSSSSSGTHTPTIPITTTNPLGHQAVAHHQAAAAAAVSSSRPLPYPHPHAASQLAMGFPEAQPDTPPQTPPNMKVSSALPNLLLTASPAHTIVTCPSSNGCGYGDRHGSGASASLTVVRCPMNFATRLCEYSPRDESSSGSSCNSDSTHLQHAETVSFKKLFKSQTMSGTGFVPPV